MVRDFLGAIERLQLAIDELLDASDRAMRLKDQAMFWIFVAEWSIVTASFFMAIFLTWTLMVRRRAYRTIGTTRFT